MHVLNKDSFDPRFNVTVLAYERQKNGNQLLVARRETHNVMTNFGRNWLVQRLGSTAYGTTGANYLGGVPVTDAVLRYVGLGVGGALQTRADLLHAQTELSSVIALEDPVAFSQAGTVWTFLKSVENQALGITNFPDTGRTVFVCNVLESEVAFAANTAQGSSVVVGTEVPVSEAGLYLSSATATNDPASGTPLVGSPVLANMLCCYDIFDPIVVTNNVMLKILWELRC